MKENSSASGGISFAGMLTIVFIALKVSHVITWSWLWVLSPLWISFLIWAAVLLAAVIVTAFLER